MKRCLVLAVLAVVLVVLTGCSIFRTRTPTPTSAPPTSTATVAATATATRTRTQTPTATNTATATPVPFFGPITFASGVTAAGGVINPTVTFAPGTQEIYAVWPYEHMRDGRSYTAVWYWNGARLKSDTFVWSVQQDGKEGTAKFVRLSDPNGLIPGEYRLELYIEGQLFQVATCTVLRAPTATPRPTLPPPPTPTTSPAPTATLSPEARIRAARAALVRIWVPNEAGEIVAAGSGSLVDNRGLILTNWHLFVDDAGNLRNSAGQAFIGTFRSGDLQAEREYVAEVLVQSQALDLAVLRMVRDIFGRTGPFFFPSIQVGDSTQVDALDTVFLLGYPAGSGFPTITQAIVAGRAFIGVGEWITTGAAVDPGVSGGMALNAQGLLIGVPTDSRFVGGEPGEVGYIRPSRFALPLIEEARRRLFEPGPTPPPPFGLEPGDTAVVTAPDGLNLRTGPGLQFGIVVKLPFGTRVTILLGPSWVGSIPWYNVLVEGSGVTGWCSGYYLRPPAGAGLPTDFIAFASNRTGNYEAFVMRPDGTALQNLTQHPARDIDPSWSPDRRYIAFSSDRGGDADIYILDLGSGLVPPRVLTAIQSPGDQIHPVWARDGERLAYVSNEDGDWEIYVSTLTGTNKRQLTRNGAWDSFPTWSPDSSQIIFTSERDGNYELYAVDVATGFERRLTNNPTSDAFPSYSPDGTRIVFASARSGLLELYTANPAQVEATLVRLTQSTATTQPNRYPDWSPDGQWIAFTSWRDGQADLFAITSGGTNLTRLTNTPGDDEGPAWYQ